jgi:hypothetical protein
MGIAGRQDELVVHVSFIMMKPLRDSELKLEYCYLLDLTNMINQGLNRLDMREIPNDSTLQQITQLGFIKEVVTSSEWSISWGFSASIKQKVTAGVPGIASSETTFNVDVSTSVTQTNGEVKKERKEDSITVTAAPCKLT